MKSRLMIVMGTVALILSSLLVFVGPATAEPYRCTIWSPPPDRYFAMGISFKDGTAIYRGPWNDCVILGRGYPVQTIDVHCKYYNGSNDFVYLRDTSTGVAGWSRLDTLNWDGSFIPNCY